MKQIGILILLTYLFSGSAYSKEALNYNGLKKEDCFKSAIESSIINKTADRYIKKNERLVRDNSEIEYQNRISLIELIEIKQNDISQECKSSKL